MKSSNVEEGDLDSPSRNNVEDPNTLCWREADHGDGDDGESGAFAPRLWRPLGGAIWLVIAHGLSVVSPAMRSKYSADKVQGLSLREDPG